MRPGKAAASPTSRPVVVGHKTSAQNAQTAVSGIGAAVPVVAPKAHVDLRASVDDQQAHAAQVAAAASAAAGATDDVEDRPAGAPPVAVALDPPVAIGTTVAPPSPEAIADLDGGEKPPAADSSEPTAEAATEPATEPTPPEATQVEATAPEPTSAPPPPPDLVPDTAAPIPEATHNPTHGKTIMPLVNEPTPQAPAPEQQPETPPPAEQSADAPSAPSPTEENSDQPKEAPKNTGHPASTEAKGTTAPEIQPQDIQDIVVSHHATSVWWHSLILVLLIIVLAVVAVDILLDAEIITVPFEGVPYTDFF